MRRLLIAALAFAGLTGWSIKYNEVGKQFVHESIIGPTIACVARYGVYDSDEDCEGEGRALVPGVWYDLALKFAEVGVPLNAKAISLRAKIVITNDTNDIAAFRSYIGTAYDTSGFASWEIHAVANEHIGVRQSWSDTLAIVRATQPGEDGKPRLWFMWEARDGSGNLSYLVGKSFGLVLMVRGYNL